MRHCLAKLKCGEPRPQPQKWTTDFSIRHFNFPYVQGNFIGLNSNSNIKCKYADDALNLRDIIDTKNTNSFVLTIALGEESNLPK